MMSTMCFANKHNDSNLRKQAPVNCDDPRSLWETYVCELESGPPLQQKCRPLYIQQRHSKGLIVAFHGYSACPDSFEGMVEAWVPAGYDVIIPLIVGHGRESGECADMNSNIFNDFTTCADGYRIDGLPLTRQGYIDFVERMNAIVKQEAEMRKIPKVFVVGLSQGGSLASYAVSSGRGLYDATIPMNAFFGLTDPSMDREFTECIEKNLSKNECIESLEIDPSFQFIVGLLRAMPEDYSYEDYAVVSAIVRKTLTDLAEYFDALPDDETKNFINAATYGWGPTCADQEVNGRGGICAFRLRNLLATHSFAAHAHRLTGSYRSARARTQFVTTERDGSTRNSLIVQAAQGEIRAKQEHVSFCIHRLVPGCDLEGSGNECGVPHAFLSRSEHETAAPGELYWEDDIQGNSTRYFRRGKRMGIDSDTFDPFTVRDDCVQLDPRIHQDPSLVLPAFRGLWIRIAFDPMVGPLSFTQQTEVAGWLFVALNLQSGAVVPTNLDVVSGGTYCLDSSLVQDFYLEFPSDQVSERDLYMLETLVMEDDYLDGALGTTLVLELEIAGRRPRRHGDQLGRPSETRSSKSKGSKSHAKSFLSCHY